MKLTNPAVGESMSRTVIVMGPNESLQKAYSIMQAEKIRHIPVLDDGRAVGILSDRDVMLCASTNGTGQVVVPDMPVSEAMSRHPYSCKENTKIGDVISLMRAKKIDSLIVTGDGRRLIGLITSSDLLDLLDVAIDDLPSDELPFDFEIAEYEVESLAGRI